MSPGDKTDALKKGFLHLYTNSYYFLSIDREQHWFRLLVSLLSCAQQPHGGGTVRLWARSREEAGRLARCAPARAFPADPAVPETSSQRKWWGPHDEAVGTQKGPPATATLDELGCGWVTECEQLEMERSGRWV